MMQTPKIPEREMLESDYSGLPAHTRKFVERIHRDGLDRVRIHGLFVLLGLCAGAPDTQSRIDKLFQTLSLVVPVDRNRNIDEVVGHVYDGYEIEAFGCGIFQMLLHARSDISGSMQIAELIKSYLPLVYSWCFNTLQGNSIEYFLGLERGQVPLLSLMQPMATDYAKQMWGFQSSLFYRDQEPIDGVDDLTVRDWHAWVLQNAKQFDTDYPTELIPFSKSNIALLNIPQWRSEIEKFEICDAYIDEIWGYSASSITGDIETLEYKALLVHLVYSSLTSSREVIH